MTALRFAVRQLTKSPGFTAVAVLTLALGIGACTAIFSIVDGVLLRPLAFPEPGQLVWIRESTPSFGLDPLPVNARHFLFWREHARSFEGLTIVDPGSVNLTGVNQPERLAAAGVSPDFFAVLGTTPALGRSFVSEEEIDGRHRVVVISDSFWHRAYAADPAIVGRTILLDDEPHTVIGVLPADFQYPLMRGRQIGRSGAAQPDLYRPKVFSADELRELFGRHNYGTIARLRPGINPAEAATELNGLATQILAEARVPEGTVLRAIVVPLHEAVVGHSRRGLLVLFAAVTAVLLIACVNLMNFLLAQAEQCRQEAAVRLALGASRGQLLRQALAESMAVALSGGALGVLLADVGVAILVRYAPADLPRLSEVRVDGAVLAFALGATVGTGLLFGLLPAWRRANGDPQDALAAGNRTVTGGHRSRRMSNALVATEVGLSVVLLAAAALLAGSFVKILRAEKGFSAPTVLSAEVTIPFTKYRRPEQRLAFFERVIEHVSAAPGIASTAMINTLPLQGENWIDKAAVAGDPRPLNEKVNTNVRFITGSYFTTMGIPLRSGRVFHDGDRSRKVVIISERLAHLLWPGQDPIGRRLERWKNDEYVVIGVAGDVRPAANRAPVPTMYRPHWDWPPLRAIIVARAAPGTGNHLSADPRAAADALRAALRAVDPDIPLPALRTMSEILDQSVAQQRFQLLLAGVFAGAAVLLTAFGIYGVVAYAVTRRTRELGIRAAFGAGPGVLRRTVLRQGMMPVGLGLVGGIGAALACNRVLSSLLYETSATDPVLLGGVTIFLALTALLAGYVPARRATRIDPLVALRTE